ncbi:MAG: DUF2019 domain-containing protein [Pseudolysinimonas sp.]
MAADFIALRIARDQAFNTPRKANKFFERAHAVAVRLRATAEGRAALLAILDHEDRGVRLGAAAECTPFAATEATKVFRELIEPRGRHSFDAEMTLKEFEAGRLKMDW